MKREKKRKIGNRFRNLYIGLVLLFLYVPIIIVIIFSFNTSRLNIVWEGFTVQWYGTFFKNRILMEALYNSLIVAVVSTIVSTIIGTLGAVGLSKYEFPGKKIIDKLLYMPIIIPEIVLGISLLSIFSILNLELSLFSIILAHITFCIPFVVITVRARLSGFDRSLEEAAMDLGANRFKTFIKITLPLIMPGILSGAMMAFALSLDDVVISFFTCGPGSTTLPIKILSMVKTGVTPEVNALSSIIMLITIIIISIHTGIQVKRMKKVHNS